LSAIPPVTAADPEARSADPVAANIEALRGLFPDAFTERQIDFDLLRQLLGDAVDDGEEKYGLNWSGKRQARRLALTPSLGTLRPASEDSVDWENTRNLVIEGENLEVLKLLQKSYAGRVKLIYIDPPYNTGKDFVYPDDYSDSLGNYLRRTGQLDAEGVKNTSNAESSGRYHTEWLNMMYPRLMLARNLLREDGILCCSVDDREAPRIRQLLDAVFGDENFLADVAIGTGANQAGEGVLIQKNYEKLMIYARSVDEAGIVRTDKVAETLRNLNDAPTPLRTRLDMGFTIYYNPETRDVKTEFDYDKSKVRLNSVEEVYTDIIKLIEAGYKPLRPGLRNNLLHRWRWGPQMVLDRRDELVFRESKDGWQVLFRQGGLNPPKNLWNFTGGAQELSELFGGDKVFDFPKGVAFLQYITSLFGAKGLTLDFFAGSGTTGHAVMAQNAADGGSRAYIQVQLPEVLNADDKDQKTAADFCQSIGKPPTIAELTKERLRRAGAKIRAANPGLSIDVGFRVYKLATSNLKIWTPGSDLESDLVSAIDNVVDGRSEDDLMVELLLKQGIDLTEPVVTRTIAEREVHAFGGGVLMVCLAKVTDTDAESLADGIVDWLGELSPPAPTTVFFKDSGFENDQAKTNVAAILEQRLGDQLLKVRSV